ncbi:N-acetylmuramoyl-L-alanine amidase family protein [Candidatus Magnetomonas plexicatena]|uniref:N-acetylmuramoyl-L-alanine amidase family protein n=1 Tax=Candidatus Magnetomonas plexicatena TaxID=2552947 RepID=UPI001103C88B|nr:N-acetylmuramoyl-L-alanine amidase [Nitrospirales bacterium LBB_01]
MTKKYVLSSVLVVIAAGLWQLAAMAMESSSVVLRFSEQTGNYRFVFELPDESWLNQAKVAASYSVIKISLLDSFTIATPKLPDSIKFSSRDNSIYLNVKNLDNIKVTKLNNPYRLVVDAYVTDYKKPEQSAPPEGKELKQQIIVIDAGHGGNDIGIPVGNTKESVLTLSLANELSKMINVRSAKAVLIRKDDSSLTLAQRITEASKRHISIFLSLHVSEGRYFSVYRTTLPVGSQTIASRYKVDTRQGAYSERSLALAQTLETSLKEAFNDVEVYHREMPLPLLSAIAAPAVLIEIPHSSDFLYNAATLKSISEAIYTALVSYAKK